MRFSLAINLERMEPTDDMVAVADHVLEMVQLADSAGFDIAWAAAMCGIGRHTKPTLASARSWDTGCLAMSIRTRMATDGWRASS